MWFWLMIIVNITAIVLSAMVVNRGISNSCQNDIIFGLVLLYINLCCLVININRKIE